jgi:pimeloyl-ACP methyl ester carboxylesterase
VIEHHTIHANGIRIHYAETGVGAPVVLCHGFPEHWSSWRNQIPVLAEAGFRVIAPDMRGYGRSSKPPAVEAYDILELVADMTGLLDALELQQASVIGHDWGAIVAWHMALLAPERLHAVGGLGVPFMPRPPRPLTELIAEQAGDNFNYLLYFQEPGAADRELDHDPRRTLSRTTPPPGTTEPRPRKGVGMLYGLPDQLPTPPWFDEDQFDALVGEYERTGFTGGINWYRNLERNWHITADLAGRRVEVPALFVAGANDPAIHLGPVDTLEEWVPDLRVKAVLADTGHWVQQERPEEVNRLLVEFLTGIGGIANA